jgi:hypothetical protein
MFSLQQNQRTRGTGFALKWGGGGGVAQTMYTHASKCKNNKIRKIKKNTFLYIYIHTYLVYVEEDI